MPNRLREVKPWEAVRVRPNSLVWTKKVHRPTRVVTEFHCTITPAIITFRRVRGGEEEGREERRNKELSNTTIVKNVHRYVWFILHAVHKYPQDHNGGVFDRKKLRAYIVNAPPR